MEATLSSPGALVMPDAPLYLSDPIGFEDLYRREYPSLVAVARALTGDYSAGEDMVQDAMVRTYVHWRRVQRYGKPGAWCLRVVTHLCRDRWQRKRTERRWLERQPRTEAVSLGPDIELVGFWQAVRRLPERPRLVVTLYYAGDRSVAEVASIVGVPEGTVKSDLSRARTVLSAELER